MREIWIGYVLNSCSRVGLGSAASSDEDGMLGGFIDILPMGMDVRLGRFSWDRVEMSSSLDLWIFFFFERL